MKLQLLVIALMSGATAAAQGAMLRVTSNGPGDNHLYTGKSNVVKLPYADGPVVVRATRGRVRMLDRETFFLDEPHKTSPASDTVSVFGAGGRKLLFRQAFAVARSGGAYFQLAGIDTDTIRAEYGARPRGNGAAFYCPVPSFNRYFTTDTAGIIDAPHRTRVTGFTISVKPKHGELRAPIASDSNRLSDGQKDMLRSLSTGDRIYIDNVTWDCGGCRQYINPFSLDQTIHVR